MSRARYSYLQEQILESQNYQRVRIYPGAYEVLLDGKVIGAITPADPSYGRRAKDARLTGYPVATHLGPGTLDEMTEALVLHELDQRATNPTRRGTQRDSARALAEINPEGVRL